MSWTFWKTLVAAAVLALTVECYPQSTTSPTACSPCPAGSRVVQACSQREDTKCEPCNSGTFTDTSNQLLECQICSTCPPGSYLAIPCTPTADSTCLPCSKGPTQKSKYFKADCKEDVLKGQGSENAVDLGHDVMLGDDPALVYVNEENEDFRGTLEGLDDDDGDDDDDEDDDYDVVDDDDDDDEGLEKNDDYADEDFEDTDDGDEDEGKAEKLTDDAETPAVDEVGDDDEQKMDNDEETEGADEEEITDEDVKDYKDDNDEKPPEFEIDEPDYSEIDEATAIVDGGDSNDKDEKVNEELSTLSPDQVDEMTTRQPEVVKAVVASSGQEGENVDKANESSEDVNASLKSDETATDEDEEIDIEEPAVASVLKDERVNEQEDEGEAEAIETAHLQTDPVDGEDDDNSDDYANDDEEEEDEDEEDEEEGGNTDDGSDAGLMTTSTEKRDDEGNDEEKAGVISEGQATGVAPAGQNPGEAEDEEETETENEETETENEETETENEDETETENEETETENDDETETENEDETETENEETETENEETETENEETETENEETETEVEEKDEHEEASTEPAQESASPEDPPSAETSIEEKSTEDPEEDVEIKEIEKGDADEDAENLVLEGDDKDDSEDKGKVGAVREDVNEEAEAEEDDADNADVEDGYALEVVEVPTTTLVPTKGDVILTLDEAEAKYKAEHPEEEGSGSDEKFIVTEYPEAQPSGVEEGHGLHGHDHEHESEHVGPDHVGKLHHGDTEEDIESKKRTAIIVGVAVGGVAIFTLAFFASRYCRRRSQFKEMKKVTTNGDSEAIEFRPIPGTQTGIYEESDALGTNGLFRQGPKMGPPSPRIHNKGEHFAFPDIYSVPDKERSKTSAPLLSPNSAQGVSAPASTQEPLINGVEKQLKYIDDSTDDEYVMSVRERLLPSRSPDPKLNNVVEETVSSIKRNSSSISGSQRNQSMNGGVSAGDLNSSTTTSSTQGSGSFERSTSRDSTDR